MPHNKRRIPTISIRYNNLDELEALEKEESFRKFIYESTLDAIKEGIQYNEKTVKIFEIERTGKFISLKRDKWKTFLNKINKTFEQNEQYEKCLECQSLINKV